MGIFSQLRLDLGVAAAYSVLLMALVLLAVQAVVGLLVIHAGLARLVAWRPRRRLTSPVEPVAAEVETVGA